MMLCAFLIVDQLIFDAEEPEDSLLHQRSVPGITVGQQSRRAEILNLW